MSGSTRSIPCMSVDGKDRPTSTIRIRSSSSRQAMFRPTSPTPPRKTTRQPLGDETGVLQSLANPLPLLLGGRNQRQPRVAHRSAGHLEGRLQGYRVRGDEQGVEKRRQGLVD